MHYLITGGAGFIGSHLSEHLLRLGHRVTIIDDLSTGSIRNIAHLRDDASFRYLIGDMYNPPLLAELVDDADAIFHMAAAVGVKLIVTSPVRTMETNIRCTELLLELAAKKNRKTLIASTSEVYGKSKDLPFREDGDLVMGATNRGRWSYACSKAIDEFLAIAYWREKGLPTVVTRLFNTVGPRQTGQYGMVIPRFVQQALAGDDITVYGDGSQQRCFGHVADVVVALNTLMESDQAVGEVFNVGTQQEISILDLARKVRGKTGSSSEIRFVPFDVAYDSDFEDMPRRIPSLVKIAHTIGWTPTRTLDDILDDVIAFYTEREPALAHA
ncbi:MAG TPA: GDP-mannose 4,6-dehydratase [Longimicrobium sp.]|nr:GDP-mannose 4,6-dehydratase [Longimicrobium sp.]